MRQIEQSSTVEKNPVEKNPVEKNPETLPVVVSSPV
jgi:hypothetical protein